MTGPRLRPRRPCTEDTPAAAVWNRIGGLLEVLGRADGIEPATALAVWQVECGGLPFRRGRPVLRFENHVFFREWGQREPETYDRHFRFGGRGAEGAAWQNHLVRTSPAGDWHRFHGDQAAEYRTLALASRLAGREAACRSASFGGPQIMGFNHAIIGQPSAAALFLAFGRSERWQVAGFFAFCAEKDILGRLREHDWAGFAAVYNGPGNAAAYAEKIAAAHAEARLLLRRP